MSLLFALLLSQSVLHADVLVLDSRLVIEKIEASFAGAAAGGPDQSFRTSLLNHVPTTIARKLEFARKADHRPSATMRIELDDRNYAELLHRDPERSPGLMMFQFSGRTSLLFADGHQTPGLELHFVGFRQTHGDQFLKVILLAEVATPKIGGVPAVDSTIHGALTLLATQDARCAALLAE